MTEREFSQAVERLLWVYENPNPALDENLLRIKSLIEEHEDSWRVAVSLVETLLKSNLWVGQDDLAQTLLWALRTLQDHELLKLGTGGYVEAIDV